ncbi:MAG: hypothetical protein ABSG15_11690 [FCB group bacterium]|jgi:regulation of enolase protein 1 (concanavalin A-like superfamily)
MNIIKSINNVPIRITDERWFHIIENHDDLSGYFDEILDTLEYPDFVIKGYSDAKIALRIIRSNKYLAVVYKETSDIDGFLITAYFTTKININSEEILWKKQ